MANGFVPINTQSGSSPTGLTKTYAVASGHASLLAPGDWVTITGTGDIEGRQEVDVSTAANPLTGVIRAVDFDTSDLERQGLPASTAGTIKVTIDPATIFEADISNGTVALTDIGSNADIVATAATQSGSLVQSNMTVDAGTFGAASGQVRILGIKDGVVGATATVFCRPNESTLKSTVGV